MSNYSYVHKNQPVNEPDAQRKRSPHDSQISSTDELLRQAIENPSPETLTPNVLMTLQQTIGNQAVGNLISRSRNTPTIQNKLSREFIQKWPAPEINDHVNKNLVTSYKCHDAVVYWLLRTDNSSQEAVKILNRIHKKKGASANWISDALGYTDNPVLYDRSNLHAGDIVFLPTAKDPTHSMVAVDQDNLAGFNNLGTFGSEPDAYGQYDLTDSFQGFPFWSGSWEGVPVDQRHAPPQRGRIGVYKSPVHVRTANDARTSLQTFINNLSTCFITTAVTSTLGLPDNCEELTTLRRFRDNYLVRKPQGDRLVEIYYEYSPFIVEAIARQPDADRIYHQLYSVIRDCVDAVNADDNEFAYKTYCDMVVKLKDRYAPELDVPSYVL